MKQSDITLWEGDCLELMKDIPNGSIDAIICDLPYGTTACKWDTVIPFKPLWEQYKRIIKPNGAIVLFGSEPFSSALRMSNIKNYKYDWIWVKNMVTGQMLAKRQPLRKYENIHVFYKKQCIYNRQMTLRTAEEFKKNYRKNDSVKSNSEHYISKLTRLSYERQMYNPPTNILEFKKDNKRNGTQHPTQKPVALMEYLIKTYTNEGDMVLDNTMGSGTTMVACVNLNRKGIGIEQDPKYFEIAQKRIQQAKMKLF